MDFEHHRPTARHRLPHPPMSTPTCGKSIEAMSKNAHRLRLELERKVWGKPLHRAALGAEGQRSGRGADEERTTSGPRTSEIGVRVLG
jgi:hypothetical protein